MISARTALRARLESRRALIPRSRSAQLLTHAEWEHHLASSTANPDIPGADGTQPTGFGVAQRAHSAHVQGRSQGLVRRDLLARRIAIGFAVIVLGTKTIAGFLPNGAVLIDLTQYVGEGPLVVVFATIGAVGVAAALWAYSWRLDRWTGRLSKPVPAHGPFVVLPEVRSAVTRATADQDANLPSLLRQCADAMTTRGESSTVAAIFSMPLTAVEMRLRTVSDISTFRCSLVVANPHPDAPAYHLAAGAVLAHPLMYSQFVACVPSGFTAGRVHDVGIESHAYQERFSTITSSPPIAQALLNPRTVEWVLSLPDDVALVFFRNLVITVALTTLDPYALDAMESVAVAAVHHAPTYPPTNRRPAAGMEHRPLQSAPEGIVTDRPLNDPREAAVPGVDVLPGKPLSPKRGS